MIKAYILVVVDPLATKEVVRRLRDIPLVAAVNEVMGPYDIVVEVEAEQFTQVAEMLTQHVRRITGVASTTSLVVFPSGESA